MEGNAMGEYLSFKKMITPIIIQIVFWIGVTVCVVMGIGEIFAGSSEYSPFGRMPVLIGLATLVLGPLYVRVMCELVIVLFKVHECLHEINKKTPLLTTQYPVP